MNIPSRTDEIARLAYAIWEQEGRPHGRDQRHWLEAERQLAATATALPVKPRATTPKKVVALRSTTPTTRLKKVSLANR